ITKRPRSSCERTERKTRRPKPLEESNLGDDVRWDAPRQERRSESKWCSCSAGEAVFWELPGMHSGLGDANSCAPLVAGTVAGVPVL
ncbi:MAG: hypothetical protein AAGG44_15850, partial [Planctomycetota bacterium]